MLKKIIKIILKRAELYVLRKKDAFNIKKDYPNIWQRINKKSIYNIKSLKSLTLDIINRYCEMNGLIVKGKELVKTKGIIMCKKINNKNNNQISSNINTNTHIKTNATSKIDFGKKMVTSLKSSIKNQKKEKVKFNNDLRSSKSSQNIKFNINDENINNKEKKERSKSFNSEKNRRRKTKSESSNISSSSSSLSNTLSEKTINRKNNRDSQEENKNNYIQNNIIFQKLNNNKINMTKSPIKQISRIHGSISSLASVSAKTFIQKNTYSKKSKKLNNTNNNLSITGISTIKEFNTSYSNNFCFLKKESKIKIHIKPNYKNINEIAEGNYINNNQFQNLIEKIIKYYNKITNSLQKDKKYHDKFNYIKFFTDKIQKNQLNFDSQIDLNEKNSMSSEKNDKNNLLNEIKNKLAYNNYNNSNEYAFPISKNKYILDSGDNKSINSLNPFNSIHIDKNKENLSDYNEFNISEGKLDLKNSFQKEKGVTNNMKINKDIKKGKSIKNLYANNIVNKKENNIQEVNLNYVNNICDIF